MTWSKHVLPLSKSWSTNPSVDPAKKLKSGKEHERFYAIFKYLIERTENKLLNILIVLIEFVALFSNF